MEKTPTLHIRNASFAYQHKFIFTQLNLDLPAGKWIALIGKSGIGKSSLLRMIAGLTNRTEQSAGEIFTDNQHPVPAQIAYMSQQDLLIPWLNVLENALLSIKLRKTPSSVQIQLAKSLLAQVGLQTAIEAYPQQLSGGMRQRVALVRTLMQDKPIVLMDEAFSALDALTRYQIHQLVVPLLKNKTVFFVTHDPVEALRLADEIYIMRGGKDGLEKMVSLTSKKPRNGKDPMIARLQAQLFTALGAPSGLNLC